VPALKLKALSIVPSELNRAKVVLDRTVHEIERSGDKDLPIGLKPESD
jgi:hypothetical protein